MLNSVEKNNNFSEKPTFRHPTNFKYKKPTNDKNNIYKIIYKKIKISQSVIRVFKTGNTKKCSGNQE